MAALTLVTAISLTLVAMVAQAEQPASAERPTYVVGDQWTYNTSNLISKIDGGMTLEVKSVSQEVIELERKARSGNVSTITETPETNLISDRNLKYSPNSGYMSFPLSVGKTWSVKSDFSNMSRWGQFSGKDDITAKVVEFEEVTVAAGRFKAFIIEYSGWYNSRSPDGMNSGSGRVKQTIWYAPEIKRAIKGTYESTDWDNSPSISFVHELKSYKLK